MESEQNRQWAAEDQIFLSTRKDAICDDLRHRLGKICSNLSETEFTQLIDRMADNKLKGEQRGSA